MEILLTCVHVATAARGLSHKAAKMTQRWRCIKMLSCYISGVWAPPLLLIWARHCVQSLLWSGGHCSCTSLAHIRVDEESRSATCSSSRAKAHLRRGQQTIWTQPRAFPVTLFSFCNPNLTALFSFDLMWDYWLILSRAAQYFLF